MSNRNLMAGESIEPFTNRLVTLRDSLGYPICTRCNCRIFEDDFFCESCSELVLRDVESISFAEIKPVVKDD